MATSSQAPQRGFPPPANGSTATRVPFPQAIEDFENDGRVSFSQLTDKWTLEDDDGSEWEYNVRLKKWIQSLDETLLDAQRQAYAVQGVDEAEPAQPQRKRKQESDQNSKSKKARSGADKNTAVYITSIPLDASVSEVHDVFSKCGVVAEEIDSGKPRIKLYSDEAGKFKGDALVVYFRPESVRLAIQLLDDADFRLGQEGPAGKMTVKEADWSFKKVQDKPAAPRATKDQKKIIRKTQKLNDKLADWDDDDPSAIQETSSRWDKVVILKHMFTKQELEEDATAILDIKDDIRDECSKLGEVTNVVLFDKEPDGVASVRFAEVEAAKACVRLMDGRSFSGQKVEAYIADGNEKFKKTSEKKSAADEDDGQRADQFGQWLESGSGTQPADMNDRGERREISEAVDG